jgi:hypothetical protein
MCSGNKAQEEKNMMSIFIFAVVASFACQPLGNNPNCFNLGYYATLDDVPASKAYTIKRSERDLLKLVGIDCPETAAPNDHRIHTIDETFYRYSVTPSTGEIHGITQIRNDLSSLVFMIQQVENERINFQNSTNSQTNDVLSFFRSFNQAYYPFSGSQYANGLGWLALAGEGCDGFNRVYARATNHGLSFAYYVNSFLARGQFNAISYGPINDTQKICDLIDPFVPNKGIDLCHLFASMDGTYLYTGSLIEVGLRSALTGWAGDLQTEALIYNGQDTFETILSDPNSVFPYQDLSADVDALNICRLYLDPVSSFPGVSSALSNYYVSNNQTASLRNRYRTFLSSLVGASIEENQHAVAFTFCSKAYSFLHLNLEPAGRVRESAENLRQNDLKFHLLGTEQDLLPSMEKRSNLARIFCSYILEQAGCRNEVILP